MGYYTGINKGADTMLLYGDFGYLDGSRSRVANIKTIGTHNLVKGYYKGWQLGAEVAFLKGDHDKNLMANIYEEDDYYD